MGAGLDISLSRRVYDIVSQVGLRARVEGDGLQPMRDLDQVRSFVSGPGPTTLLDLPWMVSTWASVSRSTG